MNPRKQPLSIQLIISVGVVLFSSAICFYFTPYIGYKVIALILLMVVSILAMLFEIVPVLIASILSAIIWNFFFIPPIYTFHIGDAEDLLMFLLYFVVALVNAVLTGKIKREEKKARDKEEKENTIRLYNTLLNSLSHELKTPISTILGTVDAIRDNKWELTESKKDDLLHEIDLAANRLNGQVENLLNMSRLKSELMKINLDWCDVNELIFTAIKKIGKTSKHQIEFISSEDLPLFKIDSVLIEQVMLNVLNNALLYTPENTKVEITAENDSVNLIIKISDSGKGFTEEEKKNIFDQFYRLPNSKTGGLGLGLSIVKGFVEAHNGTVRVESNERKGARFIFEIPAETSFLKNLKNE